MEKVNNNIVFYDGECGFCNSSVQFILEHKKINNVYFAPLQSKLAKNILGEHKIEIKLDTLYFLTNHKVYSKSSAALTISKFLKPPYNWLIVFVIIPKFIRDFFYDIIAKRRHQLKAGHCVIPSETDKSLFLTD